MVTHAKNNQFWTIDPSTAPANIYVAESVNDASLAAAPWYSFGRAIGEPEMGWRETWVKSVHCAAHVHNRLDVGRIVPANYYPFTPDADGGGISVGTNSSYRHQGLGADEWISWDVPDSAAGHDKLILEFWRPYAASSFVITIERGAESIAVGTYPDDSEVYAVGSTLTIDLPVSLQADDVIKILQTGSSSSIFVHSITTYQSNGIVSSLDQHMALIGTLTEVLPQSSVPEGVHAVSPTDGNYKTTGGAHQSATYDGNCLYSNIDERISVDGASYTIAQGWKGGRRIDFTRTADVQYDAGTAVAAVTDLWHLNGFCLQYRQPFKSSIPLYAQTRYTSMFPTAAATVKYLIVDGMSVDLTGLAVNQVVQLPTNPGVARFTGVLQGMVPCMQAHVSNVPVAKCFVKATDADSDGTIDYYKLYWDAGATTAETQDITSGFSFWIEKA